MMRWFSKVLLLLIISTLHVFPEEMEKLDLNKKKRIWQEIGPFPKRLRDLGFENPRYEYEPTYVGELFLVPKDTKLLSVNKEVSSSDDLILIGKLGMITDGEWRNGYGFVLVEPGLQWVQIDLDETCAVSAVVMWRMAGSVSIVHRDVIIAVSDTESFDDCTIIFNNDADSSAGLGKGTDREYVENPYGNIINGKNTEGRYVRIYSNGSYHSPKDNKFVEIEVYGKEKGKVSESQPESTCNF